MKKELKMEDIIEQDMSMNQLSTDSNKSREQIFGRLIGLNKQKKYNRLTQISEASEDYQETVNGGESVYISKKKPKDE